MSKPDNKPRIRVLSIDPGKKSGVAQYVFGHIYGSECDFFQTADLLGTFGSQFDVIVVERFTIGVNTGKMKDNNWSLELIGIARYIALKNDIPLVQQGPADAKRFVSNDKLKALEIYKATAGGHQNDAMRHLVLALLSHTEWWDRRITRVLE